MAEKLIATYVGTGDKLVNRDPCWVYWITYSPAAFVTLAEIRIHDGFDASGKEVWRIDTCVANTHNFNPPINCEQGLYVKAIDTINSYTIGYASKKWSQPGG